MRALFFPSFSLLLFVDESHKEAGGKKNRGGNGCRIVMGWKQDGNVASLG